MHYILYVGNNRKPAYISSEDVALQWIDESNTSHDHSSAHVNRDRNTGLLF